MSAAACTRRPQRGETVKRASGAANSSIPTTRRFCAWRSISDCWSSTRSRRTAGSDDTLYFQGNYYSRAQADADFAPVFSLLRGQYKAAGTTLYNSQTPTGRLLDGLSVYDWIETYVACGHRSDLGRYLDSAYNQEYGLDTQYQSSLNLVYVLGAQPKTGDWQIYGTSDQRFSIDGGNQRLPEAIAASLPKGSIVTGSALTKIARKGDGYVLTFKTSGAPTTIETDEVILTLPFSVLRGIDYSSAGFDRLKQTAIQELGYGTNTKLSLQFEQRYWDGTGPWGSGNGNIYTDLFFQNTWDSSRGIGAPGALRGSSPHTWAAATAPSSPGPVRPTPRPPRTRR